MLIFLIKTIICFFPLLLLPPLHSPCLLPSAFSSCAAGCVLHEEICGHATLIVLGGSTLDLTYHPSFSHAETIITFIKWLDQVNVDLAKKTNKQLIDPK